MEGELARAEVFVTRKKFEQADQEYEKILQMKPNRIGVYFEIAEYYRDRGDGARMAEAMRRERRWRLPIIVWITIVESR